MGLRCGIRRERPIAGTTPPKGLWGKVSPTSLVVTLRRLVLGRKMGTDVTEFKLSFGKAYLAPVYDFASKEIVAYSISMS